jgi:hypothetical protein
MVVCLRLKNKLPYFCICLICFILAAKHFVIIAFPATETEIIKFSIVKESE